MELPRGIESPAFGGLNLTRQKLWLPKHLCVSLVSIELWSQTLDGKGGGGGGVFYHAKGDQQRVREFQALHGV